MSVRAQSLVWELKCPDKINGIDFRPSHKYVLIKYADHADHEGRNIYPAVETVSKKTGLDHRTVQRLTRDMENCGLLVKDGQGPKGTNRWYLPYDSEGGWHYVTPAACQGDNDDKSLGDIPSGDIPSGDTTPPELINHEPNELIKKEEFISLIQRFAISVFGNDFMKWNSMRKKLEGDKVQIVGTDNNLIVKGLSGKEGQFTLAEIWQERYGKVFENAGLSITFME